MDDDVALLRRYAQEGADEAFAELVRRNADLVYATALRLLSDPHRAEDIVQAVFIDVARKARVLHRHPAFVSWLYTSTRYAALNARRAETRRRAREQEAFAMQPAEDPVIDWPRLRPLIDDVLTGLAERDREIVLLRYFRGLPFADVARALGINEGAARMRLDRALDRLSALLASRGIRSTAGALSVALAAQPGVAAPAGVIAGATAGALAAAAGGGGVGVTAVLFAMTKLNLIAGALALAGVTAAVVELRANHALHAQLAAIAPADNGTLTRENRALHTTVVALAARNPDVDELTKLRARIAVLQARPAGVTDATLHVPRNLGRTTPADAAETFCWAVGQRDLDTVASFVRLTDDSPAERAAFMAEFSDAVRARYGTPARLCAAAMFGATVVASNAMPDEMDEMQVVRVRPRGTPGEVRVESWLHSVHGHEIAAGDTYTLGPDGWGLRPLSLRNANVLAVVHQRIDPVTGEYVPPRPVAVSHR